jgi:roadblock/LC7 domain-containing protein
MSAMAARFCATVTMLFNTLAAAFSSLSEASWTPQHGWMYRGGDYTVVAGNGGYLVVFAETARVDLPRLLALLFESN